MKCPITLYFIMLRLNISVLNELLVIVQYHLVYLYIYKNMIHKHISFEASLNFVWVY